MWKWYFGLLISASFFLFLLLPGMSQKAYAASGNQTMSGTTNCSPLLHTGPSVAPASKSLAAHKALKKRALLCRAAIRPPMPLHAVSPRYIPHYALRSSLTAANKAPMPRAAVRARVTSYTVKAGDSLWALARNLYGSGSQWQKIYQANRGVIGANPSLIRPNQRLALP